MPGKPRIEYAGAFYHVMSRGDRREAIFRDHGDRLLFLETLEQGCTRTGWRIHCYVLLNNHFHILLETPEANLVVGMQWFGRSRGPIGLPTLYAILRGDDCRQQATPRCRS